MSPDSSSSSSSTPCRDRLREYIDELQTLNLPWYEGASSRQHLYWYLCWFLSIVAGFATSIVAGILKDAGSGSTGVGRITLVILPSVGSLAAALLTQFRFKELEDLRELGRIEMQSLIDWAKGQIASASDEARCFAVYENLREKVTDLEIRQHRRSQEIVRILPQKHKADEAGPPAVAPE